jgi:hypothetical protein
MVLLVNRDYVALQVCCVCNGINIACCHQGCEPHEELRDICLKSFDVELRDSLAVYLSEKNLLCQDELEAWDMLKLIETVLQSKPVHNIR